MAFIIKYPSASPALSKKEPIIPEINKLIPDCITVANFSEHFQNIEALLSKVEASIKKSPKFK